MNLHLILLAAHMAVFHWAFIYLLMTFLPADVWPKRLYRTVRAWCAAKRQPLAWRWRRFRTWPKRTLVGLFGFWMEWRIRPATAHIGKITCRACGLRAKAIRAPEPGAAKPADPSQYRHVIQFHPAAKKIVALCGRCQATWPEEPIYAAEGWLPPIPPQPKAKGQAE